MRAADEHEKEILKKYKFDKDLCQLLIRSHRAAKQGKELEKELKTYGEDYPKNYKKIIFIINKHRLILNKLHLRLRNAKSSKHYYDVPYSEISSALSEAAEAFNEINESIVKPNIAEQNSRYFLEDI